MIFPYMTPNSRSISHLLVVAVLCGWAGFAAAQDETPQPPPADTPSVRELPPMHLIDKNGQLVPVLKELTYEEWEALIQARLELTNPDRPPRFAIESMRVEGSLTATEAEVNVSVKLSVVPESWVRVPLRMSRAVLTKPLAPAAGDQYFLEYDGKEGYVLWLNVAAPPTIPAKENEAAADAESEDSPPGAAEMVRAQRSFELAMTVPAQAAGGEFELALDLPRNMVRSEISLLVDRQLQFMAPPAKLTRAEEGARDRITLTGAGGEVRLRWVVPSNEVAAQELDVRSLVLTTISRPQLLRSKARLRVRNLAGPLSSFSLLLPPHMELEDVPSDAGFSVVEEDQPQDLYASDRKLVTIHLDTPSLEETEVTVVGVAAKPQREEFAQFDITGFEVPQAKFQSGYHALAAEGDW